MRLICPAYEAYVRDLKNIFPERDANGNLVGTGDKIDWLEVSEDAVARKPLYDVELQAYDFYENLVFKQCSGENPFLIDMVDGGFDVFFELEFEDCTEFDTSLDRLKRVGLAYDTFCTALKSIFPSSSDGEDKSLFPSYPVFNLNRFGAYPYAYA